MTISKILGTYPLTTGRQGYNKLMELWKIYRFARFVRKQTKISKEFASEDYLRTQFHLTKRRLLIKRFSLEQVGEIVDYGRKKEYIGRYGKKEIKLKISLPKGRELLDFPIGTIQTFAEENGKAYYILLAIILSPYLTKIIHFISSHH